MTPKERSNPETLNVSRKNVLQKDPADLYKKLID